MNGNLLNRPGGPRFRWAGTVGGHYRVPAEAGARSSDEAQRDARAAARRRNYRAGVSSIATSPAGSRVKRFSIRRGPSWLLRSGPRTALRATITWRVCRVQRRICLVRLRAVGAIERRNQPSTENITYQSSRLVKHQAAAGQHQTDVGVMLVDQSCVLRRATNRRAAESRKAQSGEGPGGGGVGIQADRGDQVIVESFPFDATLNAEPPASPIAAPVATSSRFRSRCPRFSSRP